MLLNCVQLMANCCFLADLDGCLSTSWRESITSLYVVVVGPLPLKEGCDHALFFF